MGVSVAGHFLYTVSSPSYESSMRLQTINRRWYELDFPFSGLKFDLGCYRHAISVEDREFGHSLIAFCRVGSDLVCQEEIVTFPTSISRVLPRDPNKHPIMPKFQPSFSKYGKMRLSHSISRYSYLEEGDEVMLSKRIVKLSRSNKATSALELYKSMDIAGLRPNAHACNSLLACLLRKGSLDVALEVFETMKRRDILTYHSISLIIKAVSLIQGVDSALNFFEALERDGLSKSFDIVVYNTIISVCGQAKNWVRTEKMWSRLKKNSLTGTLLTYDLLVSIFVQCGQTELALEAYSEMILNRIEPNEDIMKAVIATCTKEGNWAFSQEVLHKMLASGFNPSPVVFNSVINCLGKAGEFELAFRIFRIMKSSGHFPDSYTWVALLGALYRAGRYSDVLRLFEGVRRDHEAYLNAHLYNIVLMSCHRLGLWERALQFLWLMEKNGVFVTSGSYNLVICACEVARKPEVAVQVYHRMIHKKCVPDTFTCISAIRACIWGSLFEEVEEILESVAPTSSLYNAIIQGLCLRGTIHMAKKLYFRMRTSNLVPDGKTRALMLQHLSNRKKKR